MLRQEFMKTLADKHRAVKKEEERVSCAERLRIRAASDGQERSHQLARRSTSSVAACSFAMFAAFLAHAAFLVVTSALSSRSMSYEKWNSHSY